VSSARAGQRGHKIRGLRSALDDGSGLGLRCCVRFVLPARNSRRVMNSVLQTPEGLESEKVDFIKHFFAVADDPQGLEQVSQSWSFFFFFFWHSILIPLFY
jgi:hypothetical protein